MTKKANRSRPFFFFGEEGEFLVAQPLEFISRQGPQSAPQRWGKQSGMRNNRSYLAGTQEEAFSVACGTPCHRREPYGLLPLAFLQHLLAVSPGRLTVFNICCFQSCAIRVDFVGCFAWPVRILPKYNDDKIQRCIGAPGLRVAPHLSLLPFF